MTRREELAALVAAQAQDDATDRIRTAIPQASQVGHEGDPHPFDSMPDPDAAPADAQLVAEEEYRSRGRAVLAPPVKLLGVCRAWGPEIVRFAPPARCPVCAGRPLPPATVCLVCHAAAQDPAPHAMQEPPAVAARRAKSEAGATRKQRRSVQAGKRRGIWADYQPVGAV